MASKFISGVKIYQWRQNLSVASKFISGVDELSCYSFYIVYRKGIDNIAPDTFSRLHSSAMTFSTRLSLHNSLCHPCITRMATFVSFRNVPFSVDDVKSVTGNCRVCQYCEPSFCTPPKSQLIKATQSFERLNNDFKEQYHRQLVIYITIIDNFSRFPFIFTCANIDSITVIYCFSQLFAILGMPAYIHSNRGLSLMSKDVQDFFHDKGIATSRTTPYNPQGNGQTERYNGIIIKTITLVLKLRNLDLKY